MAFRAHVGGGRLVSVGGTASAWRVGSQEGGREGGRGGGVVVRYECSPPSALLVRFLSPPSHTYPSLVSSRAIFWTPHGMALE